MTLNRHGQALLECIQSRTAVVGIIGMGYVGVPLALSTLKAGFHVLGFDINPHRVEALNSGAFSMTHLDTAMLNDAVPERFQATGDFSRLSACDVILIAVPTPLTGAQDPDLGYVENTARSIGRTLRHGQLVLLESTVYPGVTRDIVKPLLEETGLKSGREFFLGFSPERVDPGNRNFDNASVPKIVGGDGECAMLLAQSFYELLFARIVPVSSMEVAEAAKLTENIFRAVNIALVNELKLAYGALGIDIWEVIAAASTKPFGYMPFYPGPGLGGHCIPIDPFYLSYRARQAGVSTDFITLAGRINNAMPGHVVDALATALDERGHRTLAGSRILLIGIAYKKNVDDTRESPGLMLIGLMEKRGATVLYHDPFVPNIPPTREHSQLAGRRSVSLDPETLAAADAILIAVDHDSVDYAAIAASGTLVVDTRNAMAAHGFRGPNIVKA